MSKKFSIIIPTVKQTQMIKDCVESIRKYEPDQDLYEIVVVDDGSESYVQQWLKSYSDEAGIKLIVKETNSGFSHTVNTGMRNSSGKYLILVNNDIIFIKPFLKHFEDSFEKDPLIAVVGAKLLYPDMTIQHAGVIRIPRSSSFLHVNKKLPKDAAVVNQSKYFISVTGALFGIRGEAASRIGGLNESYFLSCEDTEYCLRAWKNGLRVYYNHEIEAIHQEGGTRGNTDQTKIKKGPEWFLKERETIARFFNDLKHYDVDAYEHHVNTANLGKDKQAVVNGLPKLEIGCGYNPQPGYLHLDVRPLPDVEYVCDFANQKLPQHNNSISEILSNHSIEHISWRKLPFVLGEWHRVLVEGGRIFLRTPDLEFICKTYLEGRTTPEWPGDEDFIKKNLSSEITPSWWANIKLFAGQDYDSNYHFLCFDFKMLKELLERVGFERVKRLDIKPVFSPGELQVEAFKKASGVGNVSSKKTRILIKRKGALGDVLLTTPIARKLRKDYGDNAIINIATDCGSAYLNNYYVDGVFPSNHPKEGYDRVIDLDLVYERAPEQHIIDAYSKHAFGTVDYDKSTTLSYGEQENMFVNNIFEQRHLDPARCVVAHMAVTWRNRTWGEEYWRQTFTKLIAAGYTVLQIGSSADFTFGNQSGMVDLTKQLTIHQIAALVARVPVFVSNDSGMLHVAGTTDTPIVGIFTSAKGEYRVPYRNGEYGHKVTILKPRVDCYGCLHKEAPPVVYCDCRRGDFACLTQITPEMVANAVIQAAG